MPFSRFSDQPNLNHLWASLLIEELVRQGVTFFCISPGSRSTPLTLAAANHPEARTRIHLDERGSAYMALGYARGSGQPAAMITTSGTAVANALPAVVEASTDYVSMLVLTADRPPELRDTGANQTIDQVKMFGSYPRWQVDLPTPSTEIAPNMLLTTAAQAVFRSKNEPAGPVHLNCMFRKPLAPIQDNQDYTHYLGGIKGWATGGKPYTHYQTGAVTTSLSGEPLEWGDNDRGVIVAGSMSDEADQKAAIQLANALNWPLLADVRSGLRLGHGAEATCIPFVDQVLTSEAFRNSHQPDVVLHLGGRIVSKRLLAFLSESSPDVYAMIREEPDRLDPHHQVTHRIQSGVAEWVDGKGQLSAHDDEWMERWRHADMVVRRTLDAWEDEAENLSEPAVAQMVTRLIPADHGLFVASSMPIRDVNRYGTADGNTVVVASNRGASGIDGIISSAAGFGFGTKNPVTLLMGDLALLHDLNGLQLLRDVPIIVIVVNNDGGGIFHFLPVVNHSNKFESFFGTPHGTSFEHAAAMFDIAYAHPADPTEFEAAYVELARSGKSALIEVRTNRAENKELHASLEMSLSEAVTAILN